MLQQLVIVENPLWLTCPLIFFVLVMIHRPRLTVILLTVVALAGCATTDEQVIVGFAPLSVATGNMHVADESTPLYRAVRDGDHAEITRLLVQGASVNAVSTVNDVTPLILAATSGQEQIVDALLDAGAAINARDKLDGTALIYASSKGHAGIVNKLLQHGADVNVISPKDHLDATALSLAAGNGHDAALTLLLKAGANIDWRTERDGLSALMLAAELGQQSSIGLLLSAGANPDLSDRIGNTACDLAAANGHGAVTKVLDEFYLARGQGKRCRLRANKTGMPIAD